MTMTTRLNTVEDLTESKLPLELTTALHCNMKTQNSIMQLVPDYSYKAYPTEETEAVAKALVGKHRCLKERGSTSGYDGRIV